MHISLQQNTLIHAMGDLVLGKIVKGVQLAKSFSVMMEETTDVSGKEQATMMARFVDNENVIQEHLIGASAVLRTNSVLTSRGLNLSQVRGQCHDGASNVSGQYQGLHATIRLESPKAVCEHCYAHCFNLE